MLSARVTGSARATRYARFWATGCTRFWATRSTKIATAIMPATTSAEVTLMSATKVGANPASKKWIIIKLIHHLSSQNHSMKKFEKSVLSKEKNLEKTKLTKKCPRCNEKTYINAKKCDNCGLIFSRLEYLSNKEAKTAMLKGEKEKIIYTSDFPRDLQRWKAIVLCALGGALGLHNIYVGRYIKGIFSLIFTVLTAIFILVLEGNVLASLYEIYLFIPGALVFIFWFYDLFLLLLNKYKVPVALDMPLEKRELK
ncbi:MAG: hypothetical protein PHQ62_00470 [Clostridia bacterium]|nr:hypothetical protein [Clostridia bacterium]